MKIFIIFTLTLVLGGLSGAWIYSHYFSYAPGQGVVKLEEILSIKELHLVKYNYNDLFFLYKHNDASKPVRAIAQVPVTVTAFIDLREIKFVKENDSIKMVILPAAQINPPCYEINKMTVLKTRAFQLHAGDDLYPEVSRYLQETVATRMDTMRNLALRNGILEQSSSEGKEYIESLLKAVSRSDIKVSFADPTTEEAIKTWKKNQSR